MSLVGEVDVPFRVKIPADVEAPDRVLFGLTPRQAALLAAVAAPLYLAWQALASHVPLPVLAAGSAPPAAVAVAIALGRRDGLPLDAWLLAAVRHARGPRRRFPESADAASAPSWAPPPVAVERPGRAAPLRLPTDDISADGVISADGSAIALVAVSTVNLALRTVDAQAALVGGFGRWLNALAGPAQLVVSARQLDLTARAECVAHRGGYAPHPALAEAALDHAEFLLALGAERSPLTRTVTIASRVEGAGTGEALQRAERSAAALRAIGARARVLDGPTALGVISAAVDPYAPSARPWPRTPPAEAVRVAADVWPNDDESGWLS